MTVSRNGSPLDWYSAWGAVKAPVTWNTALSTTSAVYADITNATITFVAIAGRRYKYTLRMHVLSTIALDAAGYRCTDGTGATVGDTPNNINTVIGASAAMPANTTNTESFTATGSVTRKWQGARLAGTGTLQLYADGTYIASFLVEDIGPA